jgi:hypothetical protein
MFASMDLDSRRFYSRIFNTALFNIYAVRNKLFSELLCESADPYILTRWEEAEPLIMQTIKLKSAADTGDL